MHLHRVTPNPFENYAIGPNFLGTSSGEFRTSTLQFDGESSRDVVVARFERFGGGKYRQSDFEVISEWEDVERIIEKFCEVKHQGAVALQEARRLATALKNLGWRAPEVVE